MGGRPRKSVIKITLIVPIAIILLVCLVMDLGRGVVGTQAEDLSFTLVDQEGRGSPFITSFANSTDTLTATFVVVVSEGSIMPHPTASFLWSTPEGDLIGEVHEPFVFVGANTFVSQCQVDANLSTFPPELQPYMVTASVGEHAESLEFHICSSVDRITYWENFADQTSGVIPNDWTIESPGYGIGAQWVEKLVFENDNKVLRITSYEDSAAILSRPVNISQSHVQISLRSRLWEEAPYEHENDEAFVLGLSTGSGVIPILRMGRSDRQEVLPFGVRYTQNAWNQFDIFIDLLNTSASSASIYMNGIRLGGYTLPPVDPVDVEKIVLTLGDGAYFVGHFDNFLIQEYDLEDGYPDYPASAEIQVRPSHGQWFDPSSISTYYHVNVTPCLPSNPYLFVDALVFELWNSTSLLGEFGHTEWNGSDYCNSPCRVFRHDYYVRIPAHFFDGPGEYSVVSRPNDPGLVNLVQNRSFFIDESNDAYFSVIEAGPPVEPPVFDLANTYNITIGIEFDPSPTNEGNENFTEKNCRISWWDQEGELIKNQTISMVRKTSYPTRNPWIFGNLHLRRSFDSGIYRASITALCNSGYVIQDSYNFTIIGIGETTLLQAIILLIPAFAAFDCKARGGR